MSHKFPVNHPFRLDSLLDRKLLVVSGKGGVGKTSVSLALGLLAAERGKKTLIAEVNSAESLARLLERPHVGYALTEVLPNIWGINITPKKSFEEYVLMQIKFQNLYRAVFENRLVRYFIDATPGLADLMCIGKIFALTRIYDLIIVDAPSTGHSLALLEIPSVVATAVRLGPLKSEAERIDELLHDPLRTEIAIVTLPEEMPIAETIDLIRRLEEMRLVPGPIFLNQKQESPLLPAERDDVMRLCRGEGAGGLRRIVELQSARAALSEEYRGRLAGSVRNRPIVEIPFIYGTPFGLPEVRRMAREIAGDREAAA